MFIFGKKKKTHTIEVLPSGFVIEALPGQTVLQAALEAGLQYPHDCRRGTCGQCRTRLLDGEIKEQTDFSYTLSDDELQEGVILSCSALPKSSLVIQVDLASSERTPGCTSCEGTVTRYRHLAADIIEIGVKLEKSLPRTGDPCGNCAPYVAGQFADISVPGISQPRSYSFAAARENEKEGEVSFLVRHVPGGVMSGWFHAQDRTGEKIQLNGPYGSFYLREGNGPVLCIAGGSGMSSIKSLLEHACNRQVERDVVFLFGARTREDLYYLDLMQRLKSRWSRKHTFEFIPVLSGETDAGDWKGLGGLVTDHIRDLELDLPSCQAYLSGPPEMIDAAVEVLVNSGLPGDMIFFDKYLDSSHVERIRK
jgi:toluene methyl-monooxygenase electron transfer component